MSLSDIYTILNKKHFAEKGLGQKITATLICEEFDKILLAKWGKKITSQARALYFKNGTLNVASLSSVASQEIRFSEKEIAEKINKKIGAELIKNIRCLN